LHAAPKFILKCVDAVSILKTILPAALKFKKISLWHFNSKKSARGTNIQFFCKFFACVVKFPMAIIRLFAHHRFLGAPTNGLPGAPENINPALAASHTQNFEIQVPKGIATRVCKRISFPGFAIPALFFRTGITVPEY
jgi:hypothetical protein